ncbi:MAG: tRNA lysidine(34) synthetase TilS [Tissierellia bacterium]|nr:tRNA lysidine(34) synthetase TilS [Tissierellia bacterium]
MEKKVLDAITEYKLIEENDHIVVGVSGGPDSMALLYCLLEARKTIPFSIHIAHVNHGVRGEEARSDQLFVERISKELGLPYYTINVNMIEYGKERGITAEEAGRELRYGFFRDILERHGRGKIAVAHNMNDQAETLLMRIMRGTGPDGLKGMDYKSDDIIRPILGIDRKEIEDYIRQKGIETVLDKTNLQPIYSRNKVRLELIPYIEENFNPNIVTTLWRMSRIFSLDLNFLEEHTKIKFKNMLKSHDKNSIILHGDKFLVEDRSIQQRIIRNAILELNKSLQGISEGQIAGAVNLVNNLETGKEFHLSNDIILRINYDEIIIEKSREREKIAYSYDIDVPGSIILENGYCLETKIFTKDNDFVMEKTKNVKYFDYDKVEGNIRIRNRRDGDRFIPFGMKGSKKLKDYFIDEKVPRDLRDRIPLVVDNENIMWVVGYRISELYKITQDTKRILSISYKLLL